MPGDDARCPLCGSASRTWFDLEHARILRCDNTRCGLGFLAKQPDDETLDGYYRTLYYPTEGSQAPVYANSDTERMRQHFAALDRRLNLRGKRVLDYGCGIGNFLIAAREGGCQASGVEYDDQGRATAARSGFEVAKSIAAYPDDTFDFVYMNDVIEHLRDPVAALIELLQKVKPGGAVFVVTMNMSGLRPVLSGARWGVVTNPTHLWWYQERSLTSTIRCAGVERWEVLRFPVTFAHHGLIRRGAQQVLQKVGLDASLRVLCWRPLPGA